MRKSSTYGSLTWEQRDENMNKRVVYIAEKESDRLAEAFADAGLSSSFMNVANLALSVEGGLPGIIYNDTRLDTDGVFLQLPSQFMLFAEPLLTELAEQGVYCQLKPTSFNLLASKPFAYSTLSTHGIAVQNVQLVSDESNVETALDEFDLPVYVEVFEGLHKTQRIIIESKQMLRSLQKSLPSNFDIIAIRGFLKGDLHDSLVIGSDVYTVLRKWNQKQLQHSKRNLVTKLSDNDRATVLKTARTIGADVLLVRTIEGKVVSIKQMLDLDQCCDAYSMDVYEKIAELYGERI